MSIERAGFARSAASRLGTVVKPLGFVREGQRWVRPLPGGGQELNVQLLRTWQDDQAAVRVNAFVWFNEELEAGSSSVDPPRLVYQWMLSAGIRHEAEWTVNDVADVAERNRVLDALQASAAASLPSTLELLTSLGQMSALWELRQNFFGALRAGVAAGDRTVAARLLPEVLSEVRKWHADPEQMLWSACCYQACFRALRLLGRAAPAEMRSDAEALGRTLARSRAREEKNCGQVLLGLLLEPPDH